jgi:hypothetical protein
MKIEGSGSASGSGSISQRHGSADPDPDPHQNVMDPEHCLKSSSKKIIRGRDEPEGFERLGCRCYVTTVLGSVVQSQLSEGGHITQCGRWAL